MSALAEIRDGSYQPNIHAIEKIAAARVALCILIVNISEVNFTDAPRLQPFYRAVVVILLELPVMGKVVHCTIGNDAKCYPVPHKS